MAHLVVRLPEADQGFLESEALSESSGISTFSFGTEDDLLPEEGAARGDNADANHSPLSIHVFMYMSVTIAIL